MGLKLYYNLIQNIILSQPMHNWYLQITSHNIKIVNRNANYSNIVYLNEDKEIDWSKIFK